MESSLDAQDNLKMRRFENLKMCCHIDLLDVHLCKLQVCSILVFKFDSEEHIMLSVRGMTLTDVAAIVNYWHEGDDHFLSNMGVDVAKLPPREDLTHILAEHLNTPLEKRRSYCVIWELNGEPIGHCNTNPTIFGEEAFMHLHTWQIETRQQGLGTEFVKMSLPYFFKNLQLKKLFCQPYALNDAPNKTLAKAGFEFVKEYVTVPGFLNFEQPVKQWQLTLEKFERLKAS